MIVDREKPPAASAPSREAAQVSPEEAEVLQRLERVYRMRVLLSFMLLPPLLFFIFLVIWFKEGFILVPVGVGLYLYMLAQFFITQNPARRVKRREAGL